MRLHFCDEVDRVNTIADRLFFLLCGCGALLWCASVCMGVWSMGVPSLPWWVGLLAVTSAVLPMVGLVFSGNTNVGELGVGALLSSSLPSMCLLYVPLALGTPLNVAAPQLHAVSRWLMSGTGVVLVLSVVSMILITARNAWHARLDQ